MKTSAFVRFALLLLGCFVYSPGQEQVRRATIRFHQRSVGAFLSHSEFSEPNLKALAQQILNKHADEKLFKIVFSSDADEIRWRRWERDDMHQVYEQWRASFVVESARRMDYAEVWKVGPNIGLAISTVGGRQMDVLKGVSPFKTRCAGLELSILSLMFQPDPPLRLYIESPHNLNETEARSATSCMARFVGIADLEVYFASSPWFIADARYPVINRLARYSGEIPTKAEYLQETKWFCSAGSTSNCVRVGPFAK
jgi:hypothetical protein